MESPPWHKQPFDLDVVLEDLFGIESILPGISEASVRTLGCCSCIGLKCSFLCRDRGCAQVLTWVDKHSRITWVDRVSGSRKESLQTTSDLTLGDVGQARQSQGLLNILWRLETRPHEGLWYTAR